MTGANAPREVGGSATRVSAADVARACGVSTATVSYVFNGRPGVSQEVRAKVHQVADTLGYAGPRRGDRVSERTRVLGLVLTDIANPFYANIAAGAIDMARSSDYEIFVAHTQESQASLVSVVKALVARHVDGVILTVLHPDDGDVVRTLRRSRIPFIQVSRRIPQLRADFVGVDDAALADEVFAHVVGHGHTDIAIVTGPRNSTASSARARAFVAAAQRLGLGVPAKRRLTTYLSSDGGERAARQLLGAGRLPEAIVVGADVVASGLIATLRAAGVSVPGDVAITGIDGIYPRSSTSGELTTVELPRREMATAAVKQLIGRVDGTGGPTRTVILPHQLRVGTTCGCPAPSATTPAWVPSRGRP